MRKKQNINNKKYKIKNVIKYFLSGKNIKMSNWIIVKEMYC